MFVEVVRLLIVLLFTAAGFSVSGGRGPDAGSSAVLGATLGALVGYVAGGAVGRVLRRAMGAFEEQVERAPAAQLLAGTVGAAALGLVSTLLGVPIALLLPWRWGWPVLGIMVWIGLYEGYMVAARKSEDLLAMAGLSTRPLATAQRWGTRVSPDALLLDTSAVIDGRLLPVADAGFLRGPLLVPRFVLDELQGIADAQDASRRRRGRRGLEVLDVLRHDRHTAVHILDDEVPEVEDVDAKLLTLARRHRVGLVTTDFNLQRVADLQGIPCLNVNRLAEGLRPTVVPGDVVRLPITREGKEPGQGVGFLDDGTMVVVGDAADRVGEELDVRITSNVQTSVGRMLFAAVNGS
jgi:uncharacterized protein YacL